ncbi:MAG: arylesterase [marine bacterium B5-7]|nr:MAG: arylesterase [marine bacterium B5-7]
MHVFNRIKQDFWHGGYRYVSFVLLSLCLSLAGCEQTHPVLEPLPPGSTVLAFGDSLTYGTGASANEDYPSRLAKLTGLNVINAGVPGETSSEGLARLPAQLDRYRPRVVILLHGGNDILQGLDPHGIENNLKQMIELARNAGTQVLLIAVPQRGLFLKPAPFYGDIAKQMDVVFEKDIISEVLKDASLKSDSVHPNAEGYKHIAEQTSSYFKSAN